MKRVMLLVAMLAMVLSIVSPALAQQTQVAAGGTVSQAQCKNVIGDIVNAVGNVNIVSGDLNTISNETNISTTIVQNCLAAAAAGEAPENVKKVVPLGDSAKVVKADGQVAFIKGADVGGSVSQAQCENVVGDIINAVGNVNIVSGDLNEISNETNISTTIIQNCIAQGFGSAQCKNVVGDIVNAVGNVNIVTGDLNTISNETNISTTIIQNCLAAAAAGEAPENVKKVVPLGDSVKVVKADGQVAFIKGAKVPGKKVVPSGGAVNVSQAQCENVVGDIINAVGNVNIVSGDLNEISNETNISTTIIQNCIAQGFGSAQCENVVGDIVNAVGNVNIVSGDLNTISNETNISTTIIQNCLAAAAGGDINPTSVKKVVPSGDSVKVTGDVGAVAVAGNVSQAQCKNVIGDIVNAVGNVNIVTGDLNTISNETNISTTIIQNCFAATVGGDISPENVKDLVILEDAAKVVKADGQVAFIKGAGQDATTEASGISVLPDTGGASLFALGAGALLVGGGLLARRIVR